MPSFEDVFQEVGDNDVSFEINTEVYPVRVILGACYIFIDKAYIYLDEAAGSRFRVFMRSKHDKVSTKQIAGEFLNELLNQRLQQEIDRETGRIRELLVAQAFSDFQLLQGEAHPTEGGGTTERTKPPSYKDDPYDIGRLQGLG